MLPIVITITMNCYGCHCIMIATAVTWASHDIDPPPLMDIPRTASKTTCHKETETGLSLPLGGPRRLEGTTLASRPAATYISCKLSCLQREGVVEHTPGDEAAGIARA